MSIVAIQQTKRELYKKLSAFYLLFFFGIGSLYPLLSVYFENQGLSGKQIGVLMATGPIVSIVFQPIWGMICDRFHIQKRVLVFTLFASSMVALLFPLTNIYFIYFLLSALLSVFQSAVVPISDNISMNVVHNYGGAYGYIRLWGAIGFAVAVFVAGILSDLYRPQIIFYLYTVFLLAAILLTRGLPEENGEFNVQIFKGIKQLFKIPTFVLFLIGTFLLFGTINANNTFFGLFYQHIGGTLSGVGLAFLIAAGSEAPLMFLTGKLIKKFGMLPLIMFSALVTFGRWFFYSTEPSAGFVLATTFIQGFSVGIYLPTAIQYVRDIAPKEIQVTAISLYSSLGLGLGSTISTLIGGWIYDSFGVLKTYLYFSVSALLAFVVFLIIWIVENRGN